MIEFAELEREDIDRVMYGTVSFIIVDGKVIRDKIERTRSREELKQ